jgi:predicted acyltransferase
MTSAASVISPNTAAAVHLQQTRVVSLDVFRGLAVAGMILVTDPGTYSAVYWPLLHAQWNGWTPTDMIFPAFLFAVGVAITLSFASRIERGDDRATLARHVIIRSVAIFLLGLAINGFPDYNLHTIRIPGVLQRIALCYLCGALFYLGISKSGKAAEDRRRRVTLLAGFAVILLGIYWALLKLVPVPGFGVGRLDRLGNIGAYLDRSLLGTRHLWAWGLTPGYGVTFDPEGLLSTLPAIASLLIGVIAGEWLRTEYSTQRKAFALAAAGLILALAAWLLHPLLPINKKLWTSTFALFSGGVSLLIFSALYSVLDVKGWRWWTPPTLVLGTNAILTFVLSNVITTLTDRVHVNLRDGSALTLHQWTYGHCFATWLQPLHASLGYAIAIVLLNLAIVYPLYRRGIFLRV